MLGVAVGAAREWESGARSCGACARKTGGRLRKGMTLIGRVGVSLREGCGLGSPGWAGCGLGWPSWAVSFFFFFLFLFLFLF